MYLLDTNVVSELRKTKPHGAVLAWLDSVPESSLHLSALTLGEIQKGIEITREQNVQKAAEIEAWLIQVASTFNVIPMDTPECREWARLLHKHCKSLFEDAMIAATAKVHGLTMVTRNTRDFKHFDVPVVDPFKFKMPSPPK